MNTSGREGGGRGGARMIRNLNALIRDEGGLQFDTRTGQLPQVGIFVDIVRDIDGVILARLLFEGGAAEFVLGLAEIDLLEVFDGGFELLEFVLLGAAHVGAYPPPLPPHIPFGALVAFQQLHDIIGIDTQC